ncbi:MAG: TPM domain-containing protein [Gemmatimonas sp.]
MTRSLVFVVRPARLLALVALALAVAFPAAAQELKFPAFTGYVVDDAGILSQQTRTRLTQVLGDFQRATNQQLVVATVKSLQGHPIEDYGYQLGRAWGVGQRGKDTGAILLVAPNERAVRIEVGYGLEGTLTDALSRSIIEQRILPAFRNGDYNGGVVAGVAAILRTLGYDPAAAGLPSAAPAKSSTGQIPPFLFFVFIVLLFAFLRAQRRAMSGPPGLWRRSSRGVYPVIFPGGGWGGGGFGGGGGGGFGGGGGGSFGGGGASGRW